MLRTQKRFGQKKNVSDTRSDYVKTVYPPTNTVCGGYNNNGVIGAKVTHILLLHSHCRWSVFHVITRPYSIMLDSYLETMVTAKADFSRHFFSIFFFKLCFCFDVAVCSQVHDMETIHGICLLRIASANFRILSSFTQISENPRQQESK